jgi:hypothetical protein
MELSIAVSTKNEKGMPSFLQTDVHADHYQFGLQLEYRIDTMVIG